MGLFFWYAYREKQADHREGLRWRDAMAGRSTAALRSAAAEHLASKDREIARLGAELTGELRRLGRKVDTLNRKLS